jgi:ATP synthase protein I
MDDRKTPDPLNDLGKRIDKAGGRGPGPRHGSPGSANAMAMGLRIGLELVVGVLAGVGIGWLLDRWLGTRPWGLVVCFFLGIAAGMVNVYRAVAGLGMAVGYRQDDRAAPPWSDDEADED